MDIFFFLILFFFLGYIALPPSFFFISTLLYSTIWLKVDFYSKILCVNVNENIYIRICIYVLCLYTWIYTYVHTNILTLAHCWGNCVDAFNSFECPICLFYFISILFSFYKYIRIYIYKYSLLFIITTLKGIYITRAIRNLKARIVRNFHGFDNF